MDKLVIVLMTSARCDWYSFGYCAFPCVLYWGHGLLSVWLAVGILTWSAFSLVSFIGGVFVFCCSDRIAALWGSRI